MFLPLLGIFAELERELIRERCSAGRIATRCREGWADQAQLSLMFGCSVSTLKDAMHWAERRGRWAGLGI